MEEDIIVENIDHTNILIQQNVENSENCLLENMIQQNDMDNLNEVEEARSRPNKRAREVDEEEMWVTVGRNGKRLAQKVDLYINSTEKLPKQFTFAKLLEENNISSVSRIKYINPYKIFIQFEKSESAEELINCKSLQELGWRFQKPLEVVVSYGVIKNVEADLSEKDILDIISSSSDIISVKRLKRRNNTGNGWEESESVRLGFKGSSLPAYVYIYGMKINVDPYVFPVTQCSKCWRFGHVLRACPNKKTVCPKCGKNHGNCETTAFRCVNCTRNHISMDRSCGVFLKEKRLRAIMAEFNCSYRKALQVYVPPEPAPLSDEQLMPPISALPNQIAASISEATQSQDTNSTTYASVARTPKRSSVNQHQRNVPQPVEQTRKKEKSKRKKLSQDEVFNWDVSSDSEAINNDEDGESENEEQSRNEKKERRERIRSTLNYRQLLTKLYALVTNSEVDLKNKIIQGVTICIEWLTSVVGQYIRSLPFKNMFSSLWV
ncbi:uncharacterized protein LOC123702613 [Colias croceus]|uniref:uncharacterized protein LOC123702613 n=1 Tax=Colias crocea TaxID=72248 RepID=UPI001E27C1F1|nr:uncharacterized protein LOC123702613 [Colias croceus]